MSFVKKVVIVGDGACGKTCLLMVFSRNEFPEDYTPTIYDTYTREIAVNGQLVELALWDTAGEEEYDRLRPLSYPRSNVILVCFSVDNPDSLANVRERWAPEVRHFCPHVPVILVGNKLDLRHSPEVIKYLRQLNMRPVTQQEGARVAKKIRAAAYFECSAKTLVGVKDVFRQAALIALRNKPKKTRLCVFL